MTDAGSMLKYLREITVTTQGLITSSQNEKGKVRQGLQKNGKNKSRSSQ